MNTSRLDSLRSVGDPYASAERAQPIRPDFIGMEGVDIETGASAGNNPPAPAEAETPEAPRPGEVGQVVTGIPAMNDSITAFDTTTNGAQKTAMDGNAGDVLLRGQTALAKLERLKPEGVDTTALKAALIQDPNALSSGEVERLTQLVQTYESSAMDAEAKKEYQDAMNFNAGREDPQSIQSLVAREFGQTKFNWSDDNLDQNDITGYGARAANVAQVAFGIDEERSL